MSLNSLLLLLIFGGIAIIGYFVKDLPNLFRELAVEESRGKNEREIQKEAFFRQIKGSDIDEAFNYWTSLMVDMDNKINQIGTASGKKEFVKMQQKVLMYGSNGTVTILSSMMHHVYRRGELKNTVKVSFGDQDSTKENIQNYMLMFYIAYLISSLKKDFTGYSIDPIEILLIKINDIDSHKNKPLFEQAEKNVRKELKKLGVTI
ncbi:hypothetical protein HRG13_14445 [Enterococcus faecalis]|nr:hypothetical protein [Enterococcus faecalis]